MRKYSLYCLGLLFGLLSPLLALANESGAANSIKVLLMMSGHTAVAKGELLKEVSADQPFTLEVFQSKGKSEEQIEQAWSSADLIMLDGINPALSQYLFAKFQPLLEKYPQVPVISLGDLENSAMNQGLNGEQRSRIGGYFNNAGRKNYRNLMRYLSSEVFALTDVSVPVPIEVPEVGLYHPDYPNLMTDKETAFFNWLKAGDEQPVIAVAIHRSVIDYEQRQVVDALIAGLQNKGAKAFGFFFEGEDLPLNYPELLQDDKGRTRIDLMINYRALHYVTKRRAEFEKLGVPVIHALNYTQGDEAAYAADNSGVSPSLTPFFLVMPEDTGSIDPVLIAANDKGIKAVMKDQLNALVERAWNHARLAHIPNAEKKVATFIWNYPPGEKNIGAAFLDVPSSIEAIAREMKARGYQIELRDSDTLIDWAGQLLRPYYRREDTTALVDKGLADWMPLSTYREWFDTLPAQVRDPIVERWGKPEDNAMLAEHNGEPAFVIPRMKLGNLIVLPQGLRADNAKDHASLYHDMKTPVNHAYLAVYLYARRTFGAHAYIHLGTHGSQEWLTGKERGLSVYDAPNLAVGDIPVFYPYIIDNVGEAMQAKRRGRATMISHLTPGFAKAGLYAEVAELSELISSYQVLGEGQTRQNTRNRIAALAEKLNMLADLGLSKEALNKDFDTQLNHLQDYLNQLAEMSQPLGVHRFGQLPKPEHVTSTLLQMLGDGYIKAAAEYERANGLSLPAERARDERNVVALQAQPGYQLLDTYLSGGELPHLSENLRNQLQAGREYADNFASIAELENLMSALNGGYIPVSHGGDPIRNPKAVPTGRNLIGFNPAKVPSKAAYEAGVQLMEETIADYRAKHGRYPDKLAFTLWSLETMRHQGALEAQILHALGLKPKWNQQGNVIGTEVIPYSELKRPRIDVVISATGLYRDAFPNVILWLAEAIDKVAQMKDDNNFVYRHSQSLKKELLQEGKSEEDAQYLSSVRIFSNETGAYGTGLSGASLASDTWETDDKLADLYMRRMGFAYGKDESRWSEDQRDAGLYGRVLSGTDGVIFSRSTNLYALMTNDDPFQYFGGVGLAVRNLDGKTPEMYVSNLRRTDDIKTQTLDEFINQEMRSRYFHPRWIQAMQESGYAGATAILDRVNNMWGWEVMTPEAVRDDQWQEMFEVYVNDKYQLEMREFFETHNAEALAQILERMLESVRKGYWAADAETVKKMVETYAELAEAFDVATDNEKFKAFVDAQAAGFGLAPLATAQAADVSPAPQAAAAPTQQVSGQKLEEVAQPSADSDSRVHLWLLLLGILLAGFISGLVERRPAAA
ncbi:cobaltochelatase subunit CobN [Microbulbifer thermotolerans]|uniref:cobaltochelatase subunit CobN n=1 Tax=Microbulbifer thermotolerans TaxID=252514 RepID=UPI00224958D5|nr:cobaltochelatase subunit CobN [Microbulbifer thermotolerans]MCX2781843.1 cobaltochelatase subunit CobN [Microbulbifer thermotolerans]MCX2795184.1 cobaltochelatase subunit CobN [Microbulbifer thermotolerans]